MAEGRAMAIFASCGCEVQSGNDLVPVEYDDEEINFDTHQFEPVTIIETYCRKCADKCIKAGTLRRSTYG